MPSQFSTSTIIYGLQDVDGTTTGSSAIITLPNGFAVYGIQAVATSMSGLILGPTISVGSNSPAYDNIIALAALTSLSGVSQVLTLSSTNPGVHFDTDDVIYVKVTTAALATTYLFDFVIIGYPL